MERVKVLKTTAAPILDTWSIPGVSYNAKGGGTQFFTANTSKFNIIIQNE
jgi:Bacterial toxin 46